MNALVYIKGSNITEQVNQCKAYGKKHGYKVLTFASKNDDLSRMVANLNIEVLLVADKDKLAGAEETFAAVQSWHRIQIEIAN